MHPFRTAFAALCCSSILAAVPVDSCDAQLRVGERQAIEAYPDIIRDRLQSRARALEKLPEKFNDVRVKLVAEKEAYRWLRGETVTVAFEAGQGEAGFRKTIEEAALEWTKYANIKFDFREAGTNAFREFSENDNKYAASIRISFRRDGGWGGYWSAVGTASINDRYYKPWEPSMNLGGLDSKSRDYIVGTVLHEFGHALGAHHEHQHPGSGCDGEWRWDDDAGYVSTTDADGYLIEDQYNRWPGIYTIMSGAPDYWSRAKVDANLRQLKDSGAYEAGEFDRLSIMKYFYWPSFYKQGKDSPCYADETNSLSEGDKRQIATLYPADARLAARMTKQEADVLAALKGLRASFPSNEALEAAIRSLER
jgi:hypothetical protein